MDTDSCSWSCSAMIHSRPGGIGTSRSCNVLALPTMQLQHDTLYVAEQLRFNRSCSKFHSHALACGHACTRGSRKQAPVDS